MTKNSVKYNIQNARKLWQFAKQTLLDMIKVH